MAQLRDAVEAERTRLFVGRQEELQRVTDWLAAPAAPTRILYLWGMGGLGKSALLSQMVRLARQSATFTYWLDGNLSPQTPAGFLEYFDGLSRAAADPPDSDDPVARIHRLTAAGSRVLVAIDNAEQLTRLEHWLREDVIGRLPDVGVLVVIASLRPPAPAWSMDPAWRTCFTSLPLAPLSRTESLLFLERLGVLDGERLAREAAGHPMALALASALPDSGLLGEESAAPVVSAHLLREVTAPDLQPLIEALALVLEADQDLLAAMVEHPLDPHHYHGLARISFVTQTAAGLSLHEVAREHLLSDLRHRAPERFRLLRQRALQHLRARLKAASSRAERRQTGAALLALCRDALPALEEHADLSARPAGLIITPSRPEESGALAAMLPDEPSRRLLTDIAGRFPEAVRVVRGPGGDPLGFHAMMLLHRDTLELLKQHPLGALYLSGCTPAELASMRCSPPQADTYYFCLEGRAAQPHYRPQELATASYFDLLSVLAEGARLLYVTANPVAVAFIRLLGGRLLPDFGTRLPGMAAPTEVTELDLRQRDLGEWVARFLQSMDALAPAPVPTRTAPPPGDATLTADLRAALQLLRQPGKLTGSALAVRLGLDGPELGQRLTALLKRTPPPEPLSESDQEVLIETYLEKPASADEVAARLHLSRSTYYRKLGGALASLAEALAADV